MSFRTRRRVEFRDTDAAGIVHFSAFFPWMEAAEHEMLRSVDVAILPQRNPESQRGGESQHGRESADQPVTWPRVSASCQYKSAARFEDWIDIDVSVARIGKSSVQYDFRFQKADPAGVEHLVAEGSIVVVCCRLSPGGGLKKIDIPQAIRQKLSSL